MAASRKAPVFDLKKEARKAFRDFPQLRANTFFTSTDHYTTEFPKPPYGGSKEIQSRPALDEFHEIISDCIKAQTGSGSIKHKKLKAVIIDLHEPVVFNSRYKDRVFALDHETGHFLVPGAYTDGGGNLHDENAADAFGAIRQLQRFGKDTRNLELLSSHRSYQLTNNRDRTHLSSLTVNRIIRDSRHIDFKSMSPEETIRAAEKYAKKYTPSQAELDEVNDFLQRIPTSELALSGEYDIQPTKKCHLELLASSALTTPGRFSFQIGLSLFLPFLDDKGATLEGERIRFDRKTREKFRAEFIERARHFGLEDIAAELEENKADMFARKPSALAPKKAAAPKKGVGPQ